MNLYLFCFYRGNEVRSNHSRDSETRKGLSKSITKTAKRIGVFEEETSQGESHCPEATLRSNRENL